MSEIFPRTDLVRLGWLDEPVRTLAVLAALRFVSGSDLAASGASPDDLAGFEADDAVLRLPLQRTVTTARPIDVYALRHGGAMALARALGLDASSIPRETLSSCRRSVAFMDHAMATSRVALLFARDFGAQTPPRLMDWTMSARDTETGVQLLENGAPVHVALIPDALARIEGPGGPETLAIEIDRGTERPSYMARKYAAYLAWWHARLHVDAWATPAVRILTITPDPRRKARLLAACREATAGKVSGLFWFASDDELGRSGVRAAVWSTTAGDQKALWDERPDGSPNNQRGSTRTSLCDGSCFVMPA